MSRRLSSRVTVARRVAIGQHLRILRHEAQVIFDAREVNSRAVGHHDLGAEGLHALRMYPLAEWYLEWLELHI